MHRDRSLQRWLTSLDTALPIMIRGVVGLSIPVALAPRVGLSPQELSSWVMAAFGMTFFGLVFSWRYQQPLLLITNIFVIIFYASVAEDLSYAEFIGATMLSGILIMLGASLGVLDRLANFVPMPIVFGMLAGAVLPYVVDIFRVLGDEPALIGATLLAYVVSHRYLSAVIPPLLPALITGTVMAIVMGQTGAVPDQIPVPSLVLITPAISLESIVSVTPVMVMLLSVQSNIPSILYLRQQGYEPPERRIYLASGAITAIGSFAGPIGVSLSLPATSLLAGPHAGDARYRHRAIYIAGVFGLIIALLAGIAADIPTILPVALMLAVAGLAIISILVNALQEVTTSGLTFGPVFAFAIVLSDISMFGFGAFFWGLIIGAGVSLLFERDGL